MKNHLKAFTLTEIIVAMVISCTLLALAIKVILTIVSISTNQNETSSNNNKILNIQTVLNENFINSSRIEDGTQGELIFIFPDKQSNSVFFNSQGIVMKSNISTDSIILVCDSLRITPLDPTSILIKSISFSIEYNKISYPVYFSKKYTNQVLYNLDGNAN